MDTEVLTGQQPPVKRRARIFTGNAGVRAGWRLLIFFVLFVVLQSILTLALMQVPAAAGPLHSMTKGIFTPFGLVALESVNLIAALIAIRIMGAKEHRSLRDYGLTLSNAFGRHFWQGMAWGLGTVVVLFLALRVEGVFSFGPLALHGWPIMGYAALWALGALLVGFSEELVFRGYVQATLTTGMRFWPAAVISSIIFGAAHVMNPGMRAVVGVSAAVFGFFFCLTLRRTGSLWFAIGMHTAVDYSETFLFSPSGGTNASGHLLNGTLHGPAWLTGGSIGPEASVNGAVAFLILLLLFTKAYRRTAAIGTAAPPTN
jgi:membrane protease YdiL (CAAX protease family)